MRIHGKLTALALSLGILVGICSPSLAKIIVGTKLGTSISQIADALEAQGYTVDEIHVDVNSISAEAIKDNNALVIKVDKASGKVIQITFN
ncbi:PepSY domain-containing protein [Flexibacterium corallicola]|uniref:PepSY domain-containing protein n=1 Tax=Flexibacterium corallicola TaxID=3037259 RepID=UPI00286F6103|nr:PepSY domain-containing protein [Pseudovibrio sp. M1P-2-3]